MMQVANKLHANKDDLSAIEQARLIRELALAVEAMQKL
jgi:hypothetical protein